MCALCSIYKKSIIDEPEINNKNTKYTRTLLYVEGTLWPGAKYVRVFLLNYI